MEKDILERYLRNTTTVITSTPASPVYVGLGTAGSDTGLTEPASTRAYTRQSIGFGTVHATGGSVTAPTAVVTFPQCTDANWGTISHFGIYDAETSGKMLFWGALGSPVDINVNDRFEFATNSVTITVD
jgi:hypothetical protein